MEKTKGEKIRLIDTGYSYKYLDSTDMEVLSSDDIIIKKIYLTLKACCVSLCFSVCVVILVVSLMALIFKHQHQDVNVVLIDPNGSLVHITDPRFLSVALDSSVIADRFQNFNFTNPSLLEMMSYLAPAYLRIGGNLADRLWFEADPSRGVFKSPLYAEIDGGVCSQEEVDCDASVRPNFTMSAEEWTNLNVLANKAGLTIIFDLNCLIRYPNGAWDSSNGEVLIAFSDQKGFDVMWELGNEPNAFQHVFGYSVNASQLAKDFGTLRQILDRYPRYKNSLLAGPDTTRPRSKNPESKVYFEEFLKSGGGDVVDVITWHQYYLNGRTANMRDFLNPEIFDVLKCQINMTKEIVNSTVTKKKPIWLGETSSAYGGGAPMLSNTFVSTFIWIDKLGLAAQNGLDVVIRQSLFKGDYALIDDEMFPRPDWWVSVLYKLFVSTKVVPCYTATSKHVRLYCQCARPGAWDGHIPGVAVYGVNLKNDESLVRIELGSTINRVNMRVYSYVLESPSNLTSKYVEMNGKVLRLLSGKYLPALKPNVTFSEPYLVMPARSVAFWIVSHPSFRSCQGDENV